MRLDGLHMLINQQDFHFTILIVIRYTVEDYDKQEDHTTGYVGTQPPNKVLGPPKRFGNTPETNPRHDLLV